MQLLIATHNALVLWEDGRELVLHSGEGTYYGITWSKQELYVVARANHPSRMRIFAPNMWPLDDLPFEHLGQEDDGPHQALWWDGTLYVTNTQRNRVEIWDGQAVDWVTWNAVDRDADHVNSIWCDGERFYVVEHRKQERPKRIRITSLDLLTIDVLELDLDCLSDGPTHSGLHNVYVEDGTLYTLGPSQLILCDLATKHVQEVNLEGVVCNEHYLRGLARSPGVFFIGVSNAVHRGARNWGSSRILVLDDDLKRVGEIELDERFGQIMEIRRIDELDLAHNGIKCPLEDKGDL